MANSILENLTKSEKSTFSILQTLYRRGGSDKELNYGLLLPRIKFRSEDMPRLMRKLREEIKEESSRYPIIKMSKTSFNDFDATTYHLRFSRYSGIENVMITCGNINAVWIDFKGPKERFFENKECLEQMAGEIYEIAEEILTKRTYLDRR